MPVQTHHPVIRYVAECENHGCDWSEKHNNEGDALEALAMHRDDHELRHTCHYDEHAGWIGLADCRACDYEKPRSLRKGPVAS